MNYSYCTDIRDTYEGEENALAEALALVEDILTDLDNPVDRENIQLLCIPVGSDLERLDADTATQILSGIAGK